MGGRWTARRTDSTGAGNAGVVGRGVHYLIDAVWLDTTFTGDNYGGAANNYVRYDDTENATYMLCRGGFNRVERKISSKNYHMGFQFPRIHRSREE